MGATSSLNDQFYGEEDNLKRVGHDFCGDSSLLKSESDCSKHVDLVKLKEDYKKICQGKTECDISLSSYMK
jgi:hypothetical protein